MTLSKSLVETFNATQLAQLARLTGVSTSNRTKAALAQGIQHAANASTTTGKNQATPLRSPLRILSIDVGIKNLAYCILEHNDTSSIPVVHNWQRLSVVDADADSPETYSTPELAQAATNLIHSIVLSQAPTPSHILIERQRWRTGGGPNILQWTIRVNSFEAMLWAVLRTLRQQGIWTGEVQAVNPAQIAALWLPKEGLAGTTTATAMKKYQALKLAKTRLLKDWVGSGGVVKSGGPKVDDVFAVLRDGSGMAEGLGKGDRGRKRGVGMVGPDVSKLAKLDDLADCLIQGVTWLRWMRNSRVLAERGLDGARELLAQSTPGIPGDVQ